MKQLQNNFTSPEQSKRLLELGLPADSADCYYLREQTISKLRLQLHMAHTMPCWSVGRLIEIYFICSYQPEIMIDYTMDDLVDYLVSLFESVAMSFSKLED